MLTSHSSAASRNSRTGDAPKDKEDEKAFPTELLAKIASFLVAGNTATLREFALCSRATYALLVPCLVQAATLPSGNRSDRALMSLFEDSQNVDKLGRVRKLELKKTLSEMLLASLLQRCNRLGSFKVAEPPFDFLFFLGTAPCHLTLTNLELTVSFWRRVDPCAKLWLPCLQVLKIKTGAAVHRHLLAALDRGNSLASLVELRIDTSWDCREKDNVLRIRQTDFVNGFGDGVTVLALTGFFHADTISSLKAGLFGFNLRRLILVLSTPLHYKPLLKQTGDGVGKAFLELPTNLRFRFPQLQDLIFRGAFHSTLVEAFISSFKELPKLAEICCGFVDQHDLGPVRLQDFTFPDDFLAKVNEFDLNDDPDGPKITIDSLAPFFKFLSYESFRPYTIIDIRERKTPYLPSFSRPRESLWSVICKLGSIRWVESIMISTADILEHGAPPDPEFIDAYLTISGLTNAELEKIVETLATSGSEASYSLHLIHVDGNYRNMKSIELCEQEMDWWEDFLFEERNKFMQDYSWDTKATYDTEDDEVYFA